jgi:hypothetical protein
VSLSRCAADCLAEYFALRREMATAFETPDQAGAPAPARVIHVLLAQTEQRLVATLERYGEDLTTAASVRTSCCRSMLVTAHAATPSSGNGTSIGRPNSAGRAMMLALKNRPSHGRRWVMAVTQSGGGLVNGG